MVDQTPRTDDEALAQRVAALEAIVAAVVADQLARSGDVMTARAQLLEMAEACAEPLPLQAPKCPIEQQRLIGRERLIDRAVQVAFEQPL